MTQSEGAGPAGSANPPNPGGGRESALEVKNPDTADPEALWNPIPAALGYPPDTRLLVSHLDDLGMHPAANAAWAPVLKSGAVSSASVMMPAPAAREILETASRMAAEGAAPDLGVHLTLTCEWNAGRWKACSPSLNPLLSDGQGFLPRDTAEHLKLTSTPQGRNAVRSELRAQVDAALEGYAEISHVDSHMFTLLTPENLEIYMDIGREYRLPCMIPRTLSGWNDCVKTTEEAEALFTAAAPARQDRMPLFDRVAGSPLENPPADRTAAVRDIIRNCIPGLNYLFLHACRDTPELRHIAWDWKLRTADLEVFSDPGLREFIESEGIRLIGMRELREILRAGH